MASRAATFSCNLLWNKHGPARGTILGNTSICTTLHLVRHRNTQCLCKQSDSNFSSNETLGGMPSLKSRGGFDLHAVRVSPCCRLCSIMSLLPTIKSTESRYAESALLVLHCLHSKGSLRPDMFSKNSRRKKPTTVQLVESISAVMSCNNVEGECNHAEM